MTARDGEHSPVTIEMAKKNPDIAHKNRMTGREEQALTTLAVPDDPGLGELSADTHSTGKSSLRSISAGEEPHCATARAIIKERRQLAAVQNMVLLLETGRK